MRSLSSSAASGTAKAKVLLRSTMPANTALAAMGMTLGRAAPSAPRRRAPRGSSRAKAHPAPARECMPRGGFLRSEPFESFPCESFPCLRREAPEHHVERLHLVYTEAPVSIAGIDPQLPIFLRRSAALVGDVVDAREQRGGSAAGVIPNPIDQNPWAHWRSP